MFIFSLSNNFKASKVAVLGAAGGIGQPLSMLLKELPSIKHLALYDIANIGCAADLSHISTPTKVKQFIIFSIQLMVKRFLAILVKSNCMPALKALKSL